MMPDGSIHTEVTQGNLRIDLTTGAQTVVIPAASGSMSQVIRPDGSVATETVVGNVRTSTDGTGNVFLL